LCQSPPDDIDELVACYNATLKSVLDKHAPLKNKVIIERTRVPWFNEEIKEAKRKRRKVERKWRDTRLAADLADFKQKRNVVTRLMNKARREFHSEFIDAHSGNQKKLFTGTMKLINQSKTRDLPPVPDNAVCASSIGKFFNRKIANIRNAVTTIGVSPFSDFNVLTEQEVSALIMSSSRKTSPTDPMPSKLVSECSCLLPVITKMINTSLQSGHFPDDWKEVLLSPLLKKVGADFTFQSKEIKLAKGIKYNSKQFYAYLRSKKKSNPTVSKLKKPNGEFTTSVKESADLLVKSFATVFTNETSLTRDCNMDIIAVKQIDPLVISDYDVKNELLALDVSKCAGPDGVHPKIVRFLAGNDNFVSAVTALYRSISDNSQKLGRKQL
ncbi:Hypothetical predicted protein, partial [Paramuricea clavata]